mgnify:FL=1
MWAHSLVSTYFTPALQIRNQVGLFKKDWDTLSNNSAYTDLEKPFIVNILPDDYTSLMNDPTTKSIYDDKSLMKLDMKPYYLVLETPAKRKAANLGVQV